MERNLMPLMQLRWSVVAVEAGEEVFKSFLVLVYGEKPMRNSFSRGVDLAGKLNCKLLY
jgi:hypothetical protein